MLLMRNPTGDIRGQVRCRENRLEAVGLVRYGQEMEVNLYEAKTELSQLVERATVGEEIIIAEADKPVVRLIRIEAASRRVLGSAAFTVLCSDGWDSAPSDEELNALSIGTTAELLLDTLAILC